MAGIPDAVFTNKVNELIGALNRHGEAMRIANQELRTLNATLERLALAIEAIELTIPSKQVEAKVEAEVEVVDDREELPAEERAHLCELKHEGRNQSKPLPQKGHVGYRNHMKAWHSKDIPYYCATGCTGLHHETWDIPADI